MNKSIPTELLACPFCGKKLEHRAGKRVNRYYKGEPTIYEHYSPGCVLHEFVLYAKDIEAWNTRKGIKKVSE